MNIHPLFVHFPIALLAAYSVVEVLAYFWPALRRQAWVSPVKVFLIFTGALSALVALITGGIAGEIVEKLQMQTLFIVKVHAPFAAITSLLYLVLTAAYLVRVFDQKGWGARIAAKNKVFTWSWNLKKKIAHFLLDTWILPVLAFFALVGVVITAALGAAIVYGPFIDPFVFFVCHLFWPSLSLTQ